MKTLLFLSILLCKHIELTYAQAPIPINKKTIVATISSPHVFPLTLPELNNQTHANRSNTSIIKVLHPLPTIDYLLPTILQGNVAKRQRGPTRTREHFNTRTHVHIDSLPSKIALHTSIDTFYHHQTQLQLLEFQESKKGEWLKYLPNLGMTYTIDGKPRPRISISSSILYQAKKNKQLRAAKRQSIIAKNLLEAEKAKAQLDELLLEYQLLEEEISAQKELFEVEQELFYIKEEEYKQLECSPSEYLKAKRTLLLQQRPLRTKEQDLALLKMEILLLAHQH